MPGEIVTIFGANIGPKTLTLPPTGTVPTTVSATSVTLRRYSGAHLLRIIDPDQRTGPLRYSPGPDCSEGNVQYRCFRRHDAEEPTGPSRPVHRELQRYPARQAALNANLSVNSAANPATRGQVLVLYGTGEGQTSPPSVEGVKVPSILPPSANTASGYRYHRRTGRTVDPVCGRNTGPVLGAVPDQCSDPERHARWSRFLSRPGYGQWPTDSGKRYGGDPIAVNRN